MSAAPTELPQVPALGRWRWGVCGLLLLASTLNYMDRMALNQTAARIKVSLAIDDQQYATLESYFSLAFAAGTLLTGWLVDRVSVRWVYPAAVLGWSVAGFLTGSAESYLGLLLCRLMLGFFEAGNWPCGIRTTRAMMPPEERTLGNAFFQNGTALGAVITPFVVLACLSGTAPDDPDAWRLPFRVIGLLGFVWILLWVWLVRGDRLRREAAADAGRPAGSFLAVFADRRFWLLTAVVAGVNIAWHTYRIWVPLLLTERHGYGEAAMNYQMAGYYLLADVGSWGAGFATLGLVRVGWGVHRSRLLLFSAAALLLLPAGMAVATLERGPGLTAALFLYGFAALGLFPTYFAWSQELSSAHQGKVTGVLGCWNAVIWAGVARGEGTFIKLAKQTGYDPLGLGPHGTVLALAGVPVVLAALLVALFWPASRPAALSEPEA